LTTGIDPTPTDATSARLTSAPLLAQNAVLNAIGLASPLLVGVAVTPFIIGRLGEDAFGVLSLGWTLFTLSAVFNLGLGRATTKYAAEGLAKGDVVSLPPMFWTSVVLNAAFGLLAAALVASACIWLVAHGTLKIPPDVRPAAQVMFVWFAAAIPFTFMTTTLRGMLEAGQYFAGTTVARLVFGTSMFVLPAIALACGYGLGAIGLWLMLSRAAETVVYGIVCLRRYPWLRTWGMNTRHLRVLLAYGAWLTVSNLLLPLFVNVDRFVIGWLLSVAAVAFYTVPADVVLRLTLVPSSLSTPLFPAFAALHGQRDVAGLRRLYGVSTKYMLLGMAAVMAPVIAFARPFLTAWVGPTFAFQGTVVMQVMAIGVLANAVAYLPTSLLQAAGRPDLTAKCHLVEAVPTIVLLVALTSRYGIQGAALAWAIRASFDLALLTLAGVRSGSLPPRALAAARLARAVPLVALLLAASLACASAPGPFVRVIAFAVSCAAWAAASWRLALEVDERRVVWRYLRHPGLIGQRGATPQASC
jgi:O-antigen/teichoic acid export membrane protein